MSLKISDDYLIGFVEGEGMFYVGVVPARGTSRNKSGWQIIYFLKVSQNPKGKIVLDYFKKRLGCGYLKANANSNSRDNTLAYVVRDLPSIRDKIIPFFDNKLIVKKNDFIKFKKVIELVSEKKHLTKQGLVKIIDLAYSMNSQKRKLTKNVIIKNIKI